MSWIDGTQGSQIRECLSFIHLGYTLSDSNYYSTKSVMSQWLRIVESTFHLFTHLQWVAQV